MIFRFFFLMIRRPPRFTRTDTLFPYTTLFRSKEQVATGQLRYYEPVPQSVPGIQCQVDPGELRGVLIEGQERTVHFVVFVLSCSRLMYVGLAFKQIGRAHV